MKTKNLTSLGVLLCGHFLLIGCNVAPVLPAPPPGSTAAQPPQAPQTPPPSQPSQTPVNLTHPSILVTQYTYDPTSVLVFDGTAIGSSTPYLELPGTLPAIDAAGNIYVVSCDSRCSSDINVYSASAITVGKPLRSLHTHLAAINGMKVSQSGEIFVSDGNGVAVFAPAAAGDDPPERYIRWNSAGPIAVDNTGRLYVRSFGSVAVFGPSATGAATPERLIGGPQTTMRSQYAYDYGDIAVDAQGRLYDLCFTDQNDGANRLRVLVFAPDATGDVAPIRYLTTPSMTDAYDGTGIAVDSAGTIYVSASLDLNYGAVFEFPADASGSVATVKTVTSARWGENAGGIALY